MLYEAIFIPEGHGPLPKAVIQDPSLYKYIENGGKDKLDIALVAEADHQLVGAVWGRLFNREHKGFGYVDDRTPELSMVVVAEYRNQGIGTSLMKAIASEYTDDEVVWDQP
jgi:GNAT superfamily N-acetyltransferase